MYKKYTCYEYIIKIEILHMLLGKDTITTFIMIKL